MMIMCRLSCGSHICRMLVERKTSSLTFSRFTESSIYRLMSIQSNSRNHFKTCRTSDDIFVTTPIFYVNASPHIGHLYTTVLADAHARWNRLKGRNVFFSTGTDEHGLKIQQAAQSARQSPLEHCNEIAKEFKNLFNEAHISCDDFIRTSEERHMYAVAKFWEVLMSRGFLYKAKYEGWYCISDEVFVSDNDIKDIKEPSGEEIKVTVDGEKPVVWMGEENYMFKLSHFKDRLHNWLDTGAFQPPQLEHLIRAYVDSSSDLSVSRKRERLPWGISVPGDDSQTIYVWLDALINYLTVAGYPDNLKMWPPTTQIIGKDISKFHAVFWPAFLMAADLSPPTRLVCHSHWLVDGIKMSKSLGNVVDPKTCIPIYSADGLRYFLLRQSSAFSDGNYCHDKAIECINSDLVNTLGNLLQRCTAPGVNKKQEFPCLNRTAFEEYFSSDDQNMYKRLQDLPDILDGHYQNFSIHHALEEVMVCLAWANRMVQTHEPWQLVKRPDQSDHVSCVLHVAMETLRVCGIVLQPVIPSLANQLLSRLGLEANERTLNLVKDGYLPDQYRVLGTDSSVLLKRIKHNK